MWHDDAYLLDMLIAANDAIQFLNSLTKEEFDNNRLHQYATLKAIENLAEASSKVSEDIKRKYPDIPWSRFSSLRNRVNVATSLASSTEIHLTMLWRTVREDLPDLVTRLEPLVPPEPE